VSVYSNKQDALPLIQRLQYAEEYDKAMQFVFGKTLLCRNMEAAFNFVDEDHLDCITLDGDQVSILNYIFICIKYIFKCIMIYCLD
jgi:structural maintenance of chromosome 3 (chondroitin sulfate proteoglycan 6)